MKTPAQTNMRLTVAKTYKLFIGGAFPRTESGRSVALRNRSGEFVANASRASRKGNSNSKVCWVADKITAWGCAAEAAAGPWPDACAETPEPDLKEAAPIGLRDNPCSTALSNFCKVMGFSKNA